MDSISYHKLVLLNDENANRGDFLKKKKKKKTREQIKNKQANKNS